MSVTTFLRGQRGLTTKMAKGNWGGIFAIGLITGGALAIILIVLVVGLNYCPNQPCYHYQVASNQSGSTDQRVWQVPDATRGMFSYKVEPKYSEGDPKLFEYYGLRAQERMALATDWMVWITLISSIFGIIGVVSLILTLRLQRQANDDSKLSFSLAERAHVFINDVQSTNPLFQDFHGLELSGNAEYFNVTFRLENHGKTPATITKLYARVHVGGDVPHEPEFFSGEKYETQRVVAANSSELVEVFYRGKISEAVGKDIARTRMIYVEGAPQVFVFVYIFVEYWSVIGTTDEIMSCFVYDPMQDTFSPYGRSNYNFRKLEGVKYKNPA